MRRCTLMIIDFTKMNEQLTQGFKGGEKFYARKGERYFMTADTKRWKPGFATTALWDISTVL